MSSKLINSMSSSAHEMHVLCHMCAGLKPRSKKEENTPSKKGKNDGIAFYSIEQLPKNPKIRTKKLSKVQKFNFNILGRQKS